MDLRVVGEYTNESRIAWCDDLIMFSFRLCLTEGSNNPETSE